ncbi:MULTISPECIES: hypothetical protein [Thiorhodovibrio]|uniref:hypothetical protein n=1 Tax=Thiorhodovibrio TaxID=61593 RepID=UPI001F5C4BCE|nr:MULTISPECIES: hypothetical protein [Thiorhodovibrio]
MPDLKHEVTEYLEGRIRADDFIENLGVLYEVKSNTLRNMLPPFFSFPHKCMYDSPRLIEILTEFAFQASSQSAFESEITDIKAVELPGRTKNAVIVEARKQ